MKQYHAYVTGPHIKAYDIVGITEEQLPALEEKYRNMPGVTLKIHGLKTITGVGPAPDIRSAKTDFIRKFQSEERKTMGRATFGGRQASKMRAAVNTTTGEYFDCMVDAANSIGVTPATIGQQINGKCQRVKGYRFRLATDKEMVAKRMLG